MKLIMSLFKKQKQFTYYPKLLVGASSVGLIAAFWQAAERVNMLKNPAIDASCDISPVIQCTGILDDKLAAVFGPPNAFIGIVVFSLLLAFGIQRMSGGSWTDMVRKIVLALSGIILLFSIWFFWVSLYSIGKVCIFCIFIWAASMPIGIYGLKDFLDTAKKLDGWQKKVHSFLNKNHLNALIVVYVALVLLFLIRFREFYFG